MKTETSLSNPVRYLKGVGPKKAQLFSGLGVETVEDLLDYFPFRIDDFSKVTPIEAAKPGEKVTVQGEIITLGFVGSQKGRAFRVGLSQNNAVLYLIWYNMPYIQRQFAKGQVVVASGIPEWRRNGLEMAHPTWRFERQCIQKGPVTPIYHSTKGLNSNSIQTIIQGALNTYLDLVPTGIPAEVLTRLGYLQERQAYFWIHKPESSNTWHDAQKTHAFREILLFQTALLSMRYQAGISPGPEKFTRFSLADKFLENLPFELTGAQKRAVAVLKANLSSGYVMNRLIQGDVGSGKTVVALYALIAAAENGYQSAFLAPTEVLAEQHRRTFQRFAGDLVNHGFLTGGVSPKERKDTLQALSQGKIQVLIGTHAMLGPSVQWRNIGLVVTDEQHRFGVKQRLALTDNRQSFAPHVLVMSATPIPRSLALTLYGDMDVTIIDAMPKGRTPVATFVLTKRKQHIAYEKILAEVASGHQAYVVCPVIEEGNTQKTSVLSAKKMIETQYLPGLRIGLLHGAMNKATTEKTMKQFIGGEIDVLVSTTVIEVGVDVENATCMVVLDAGYFGLASLHQLRGRVGRGQAPSYCFLVSSENSDAARRRLSVMEQTSDGFQVAQLDLEQRGPGQFFGSKQSGIGETRLSNLSLSLEMVGQARDEAKAVVERMEKGISTPSDERLLAAVKRRYGKDYNAYSLSR